MTRDPTSEKPGSVLIVGDRSAAQDMRALLPPDCVVREVADFDAAMALLREGSFDAVVSSVDQFAHVAHAAGRAEAEATLAGIGHGVCVVDREGRLRWSNPRFQSLPPHAIEAIIQAVAEMCRELADDPERADKSRPVRRSINFGTEHYFDVPASPIGGPGAPVDRAVALVWDVTATHRLQNKLNAIDAAGRELVRLDAGALATMDVGERLRLLEEKIIGSCRELMHFRHFTVRVLDDRTNRLDVLLAEGMTEQAKARQIYATTEGNGITGYVAATGRSYICPDMSKDTRVLPGIINARSSLTVPLRLHDQVVGTLNVESDNVAAFSEDDRQFAEIFGRYIAIALNTLQLLAVERHATTGQVTADLIAELSIPLNDVGAHADALLAAHPDLPDLRERVAAMRTAVDTIRTRLRAMQTGAGVTNLSGETCETDPLLANRRVLIADDEEVIRETIAAVLTRVGAEVSSAADGAEAVKLLQMQRFDLVISDIKMPHHTGYEVFATARETNADCRVILITGFGYDPHHSIVRASREGLAGVLFKPFKVDTLLEEARKALGGKSRN
jgi:CheY-like chemotaxis protein